MGECTVVLVGGNNGGKEHLLQELLGRRQGGAWCYSYRHITYDLRLLPLCALQSPALRGADCTVLVTPALDLQRALAALPALWQRSHRLVVYITDRGAARRRGVIIDPAALSAGLGCPGVGATPYSSRGVNRLLAAVDRVVHFPPVPHTLGDTHIQTVLAAAVRPGNRVRTFRRGRVWTAVLCVTLWAFAALLLALLLHFGRG